jgi:hypothetical protein
MVVEPPEVPTGDESDAVQAGTLRTLWSRAAASLRDPAFPAALACLALLLFCWPFLRVPRLPLAQAWAHLFASWAVAVLALAALARALAGRRRR